MDVVKNPSKDILNSLYLGKKTFDQVQGDIDILRDRLSNTTKDLNKANRDRKKLEDEVSKLSAYSSDSLDDEIEGLRAEKEQACINTQNQIEQAREMSYSSLNKELLEIDADFEREKAEFLRTSPVIKNLSDKEAKALAFAEQESQIHRKANNNIAKESREMTNENTTYNTSIKEFNEEIQSITSEYVADIQHYEGIIADIRAKHSPDITAREQKIQTIKDDYAYNERDLQNEKTRAYNLVKNTTHSLDSEYHRIDKDYKKQIRDAENAGKATTRLKSSHSSALNKIKAEINKAEQQYEKELGKINARLDQLSTKYSKQLESAQNELNRVTAKRDNELAKPKSSLSSLISERDKRIQVVKSKIDQLTHKHNTTCNAIQARINKSEDTRNYELNKLESDMREFVMNSDNCLSEVMDEVLHPFASLASNLEQAIEYKANLEQNTSKSRVEKTFNSKLGSLNELRHSLLINELDKVKNFDFSKFSILNNSKVVIGASFGIGAILALLMILVSNISATIGIGLGACIVVAGTVIAFKAPAKSIDACCTYIILATEYKNMPELASYAKKQTSDIEYESLRKLGAELVKTKSGLADIENKYIKIKGEITDRYSSELNANLANIDAVSDTVIAEYDKAITTLTAKKRSKDAAVSSDLTMAECNLDLKKTYIDELVEVKNELDSKIKSYEKDMVQFDELYKEFMPNINRMSPTLLDTQGILANEIYIIPDNDGSVDKHGHKGICLVKHDIKPFVVLYDTYKAEMSSNSFNDEIVGITKSIVLDIMLAFKRINSKDIYDQHLIDYVGDGAAFRSSTVRNDLNIVSVTHNQSEMRAKLQELNQIKNKMYEHGDTIDKLNLENCKNGSRPMKYNILYYVIKPGSGESISDDMIRLISSGNEFGFIPVFICSITDWEDSIRSGRGVCSDISKFISNKVTYNGNNYNCDNFGG